MISVVVPCYNEAPVLGMLYQRLSEAADTWGEDFEVLLVDDGSDEATWKEISALHQRDSRWKAVRLARNFGHQTAISAGLFYALGDCVLIIDADLQDPPEQLQRFIHKWHEGYEVVYAIRSKRKEGIVKKSCYKAFYRILGFLSDVPIPLDSGDFCLIDRRVVNILNSMPEHNRFIRGLRAWAGYRQIGITYERQARAGGEVQYTLAKLINLAIDGIFSFSTVPLRVTTYVGLIVSALSLIAAAIFLIQRLFVFWFGGDPPPGFASIVIGVFFLGGVQLISLGVIGEYIGRIYDEVKRRPLWLTKECLGVERSVGENFNDV